MNSLMAKLAGQQSRERTLSVGEESAGNCLMVFHPSGNRHDSWATFCSRHQQTLEQTGLASAVTRNEDRFRDLLRFGETTSSSGTISLDALLADQWMALEQFAGLFFDACESWAPLDLFPGFRRERERRASQQRE